MESNKLYILIRSADTVRKVLIGLFQGTGFPHQYTLLTSDFILNHGLQGIVCVRRKHEQQKEV